MARMTEKCFYAYNAEAMLPADQHPLPTPQYRYIDGLVDYHTTF